MAKAAARIAHHMRLAVRLGWPAALVALLAGGLMASVLPVTGAWIVLLVAASAATGALVLAAWASRSAWTPAAGAEASTLLESATTADQAAHALLRASLLLVSFFVGLQLALALGLGRA